MVRFLARRLAMALGILLALSIMVYAMLDMALDPLGDLRTSTAPNRAQLLANRIALLNLDQPWYVRYWDWLTSFVRGDFGTAWRTGRQVNDMLGGAIATSVQLVFAATLLAIIFGVIVGLVSALRQYTSFDYSITFVSFVLYSLPVFWVAVLLKQFLAIGVNDFLNRPVINWPGVIAVSVVSGLFWAGALGGELLRKLITFGVAAAVSFGVMFFTLTSGWLNAPNIGIVGLAVIGAAAAYTVTLISAGLGNKRALYASLTTAGVALALYFPLQFFFAGYVMSDWIMLGLFVASIGVALLIGWLYGGPDRAVSMRAAAIVAVLLAVTVFVDQVMRAWGGYVELVGGRPIATIGAQTPGLDAGYWTAQLDKFTHLLLPTIALVLISFAGYTRYQRGSMLEVLNQDYIRTARAKGLSERVVIVRHALRNALMPLASIVPVDIVSLIGGAVITETIFGWGGMGKMFIDSLRDSMIDPVMVYVMITGALAMIANLIADFLYAILDPRIRVDA
ncbi:MAG: ABC transporter permease [Micropruina sp.]|nr:ABC transporter permease [Micropruina sp.]